MAARLAGLPAPPARVSGYGLRGVSRHGLRGVSEYGLREVVPDRAVSPA
ncbi:hypothetical protein [Streptosporangium lutulentum]|uniref:Uncharacterized protein n=1 Tax=Streptosporangium lutulentum TaxID=1461250 RepID=A0ABT9QS67_9ACTN|nr:hypothetical protein [Streptosporangium lutulentum]MDP9849596.1 hypothetical protein [Streptosporangium lutulentum]